MNQRNPSRLFYHGLIEARVAYTLIFPHSILQFYEKDRRHHTNVGAVGLSLAMIDDKFGKLIHLHPSRPL